MLSPCARSLVLLGLLTAPVSALSDPVPAAQVPQAARALQALEVADFSLQTLDLPQQPGAAFETTVWLGGSPFTVSLRRHSVRSDDFQLLVQGADGLLVPTEAPEPQTWRGTLLEVPGSHVAASLVDGRLDALIMLGHDLPLWGIQPASDVGLDGGVADHVVYSSEDIQAGDWTCGVDVLAPRGHVEPVAPPGSYSGVLPVKVCEIACDADVEFYQSNGSSVANTEADIENIINRCDDIYEPDVGIVYEITTIIVRTAEPDPYSTTSPGSLLSQLANEWNANQGGVQRDVTHLFTGKNLDGSIIGIAYLSVICNLGSAYGLSQSKFSGSLISRTGLTAHELGHNWSAQHCNGQGDCAIMCSGLGGCTGILTSFGNSAINSILNKKNSVGCLTNAVPPPPPTLSSVEPATMSPLGGGVTVHGTGFEDVLSVQVGATVLSEDFLDGFTIFSDEEIQFAVPPASSLGTIPITVTNITGSSAPLDLEYVAQEPPLYDAPTVVLPIFPTVDVQYATLPTDVCVWLFALDGTTGIHQGLPLLAGPLLVLTLPVNAAGVGGFGIPIDPTLSGLTFWTQMAFFDTSFKTLSPVRSTHIF